MARIAFAATLLAATFSCFASEAPLLRVGTSGDYAPFSLRGRGFDVDVATALARDLGFSIRWVTFRWPELRASVAADRFDVAMSGVTWRPERAVVGWMSRAVAQGGPCTVGDARAGTIVVNRGGVLESWARRRFATAPVLAVDDNLSLPMLFEGGAAAAFVTDSFELKSHPPNAGVPVRCEPERDRKVYWIAPSRADDLGPRIDRWLADNESRVDALRRRWLGSSALRSDLDDLIDQLARRMAFMPAVAAWKHAHDSPIEDPERERRVLEPAERTARDHGLDAASVRRVFELQIDLAKSIERRNVETAGPALSQVEGLDLDHEIRPALSRIGDRIVEALAAAAPIDPEGLGADRLAPLGELLSTEEIARLVAALVDVRRNPEP
jgi:cyclohexadienyl dehydratase